MATVITPPDDERFLAEFLAHSLDLLPCPMRQDAEILDSGALRMLRPEPPRDPDLPVLPPKAYPRYTAEQTDLALRSMAVPPPVDGFTGRKPELDQASMALIANRAVFVSGKSGIGKTAFLRQVAADPRVRKQFKRIWWLDSDHDAATLLGLALNAPNVLIAPLDEQARLLRQYLGEAGTLLMVDNADDPASVLALSPTAIAASSTTEAVNGASTVRLMGLQAEIGAGLLARLTDRQPNEVKTLAALVDHHPRALRILAALITEDAIDVGTLEDYLRAAEGNRLTALFAGSIEALPADYSTLLQALAVTPGQWVTADSVISRYDRPLAGQRALAFLEKRGFIERSGGRVCPRGEWLPLVHPAGEPFEVIPPPTALLNIRAADDPAAQDSAALQAQGVAALDVCDDPTAETVLEQALAVRQQHGLRYAAAETLSALARLAYLHGDDAQAIKRLESAAAILHELRDETALGIMRVALSRAYRRAGRVDAALHVLDEQSPPGDWALAYRSRGEWDEAAAVYQRWLAKTDEPDVRYGLAETLMAAGRYPDALAAIKDDNTLMANWLRAQIAHLQGSFAQALSIYERIQPDAPPELLAPLTRAMARALVMSRSGDADALREATMLIGAAGVWYESRQPRPIFARQRLSHALHAHLTLMLNDVEQAERSAREALALHGERPNPEADAIAQRVIGRLAWLRGDADGAFRAFEAESQARGAMNATGGGDEHEVGVSLHNIADIHRERGELDRAVANYRRALTHKDVNRGRRAVWITQIALRDALLSQGRHPEALEVGGQLADLLTQRPEADLLPLGNGLVILAQAQRQYGRAARGDQLLADWIKRLAARIGEGLAHEAWEVQVLSAGLLLRSNPPLDDPIALTDVAERALALAEQHRPESWIDHAARRDLSTLYVRLERWEDTLEVSAPLMNVSTAVAPYVQLQARLNTARAAVKLGQLDVAMPNFEVAADLEPDIQTRGFILREAADVYRAAGDDASAAEYDLKAMDVLRQTSNLNAYVDTVVALAYTRLRLRRFAEAIDTFEEALLLAESHRAQDTQLLGAVLVDLATAHASLGQHKRAAHTYRQSLAHQDMRHDPVRYADTLIRMARSYAADGAHTSALQAYYDALQFDHIVGDERRTLLIEQADTFARAGQQRAAIQSYLAAKQVNGLTPLELAGIERGLGTAYTQLGEYESAREHFAHVLDAARGGNNQNPLEMGLTWYAVADGYRAQGQSAEAIRAYQQALDYLERKTQPIEVAAIQRALGEIYFEGNQATEALRSLESALEIERSLPQQAGDRIVGILKALADAHERRGELDRASFRHHEALVYQDVRHAPEEYVGTLDTLGGLYMRMERHSEAIKAYEEALAVLGRQSQSDRVYGEALRRDLAEAIYRSGRMEAAAEVFRQVAKSPVASAARDSARERLRSIESEIGRHIQALEVAEQSWQVMNRTQKPDLAELIFIRALQARTSHMLGRIDDAQRYVAMILQLLKDRRPDLQRGDPRPSMQALATWLMGHEAQESGDLAAAQDYFRRAIQTLQRDAKPNAALVWVFEQHVKRG